MNPLEPVTPDTGQAESTGLDLAQFGFRNTTSILKAIFYRFSLQLLAFPITVAASIYFARQLGPESLGTFRMGMSALAVFFIFLANFGMDTTLSKTIAEVKAREPSLFRPVWGTFLRHRAIAVTVVGGACWFGADYAAALLKLENMEMFFKAGAFYVAAQSLRTFYGATFVGLGRVNVQTTISFLTESCGTLVMAAIVFLGCKAFHKILAGVAASEALCLLLYVLLLSAHTKKERPQAIAADRKSVSAYYRGGLKLSGHIVIISLTALTFGHFDTLILGYLTNPAEVGIMAAALSIAIFPMRIPISIGGVVLPLYSNLWAKGMKAKIERLTGMIFHLCLLIFLPMATGFFVLAKPLIINLYGAEYSGSSPVLAVLSALILVKTTFYIQYPLFISMNRAGFVTVHSTISNVIYLALILLLAPPMGARGMAISMILAFTYNSAALMSGYLKEFKLELPWGKIAKLLLVNLILGLLLWLVREHITSLKTLLAVILTSPFLYILLILATGSFTLKDWKAMLNGDLLDKQQ
ncbi:MAG: oligosaccharide flippase family protein [bacterium]